MLKMSEITGRSDKNVSALVATLSLVMAGRCRTARFIGVILSDLGTNLDAESPAEVNQASLSVLNSRAATVVAVFSTELCGSEAIKLAKYLVCEAVRIRIGNQSYSISHRLFSLL
jgi:hypothetical protein